MPKDQRWDEIVATSCRNWNYLLKRGDSACFGVKNNFELSQKNSQLLTDRQWSRNGFCWHDVLGVHHKHSRPQVPPLHLQVAAECLSFQLEIHDSFIRVTVFLTSPPKKKQRHECCDLPVVFHHFGNLQYVRFPKETSTRTMFSLRAGTHWCTGSRCLQGWSLVANFEKQPTGQKWRWGISQWKWESPCKFNSWAPKRMTRAFGPGIRKSDRFPTSN